MDKATKNTQAAFLWTSILRAPFWAIYTLLLMILYKDLHATPFQIALFIALKPTVSLFSLYWSAYIYKRPDRLLANIVWANILGYLPFLFFPFCYGPWFVLFASAVYMMMHRGVVPAWMEIFKMNLPGDTKHRTFSNGSTVSYIFSAFLPLLIGPLLDHFPLCWRWIFFCTSLIGMGAIVFQARIPMPKRVTTAPPQFSLKEHFVTPWKNAKKLLFSRSDFSAYQMGFMVFGGCGLMIMQPALPKFFIDTLGLTYTELSIALTFCKGVGFALTSPLWARLISRIDFFRFSSFITLLGVLFPLVLLGAKVHLSLLYIAYLTYGVLQAGSELGWHLSGPIFAKEEESSTFSSVNVLTVGLRGLVIPQVGALLCVSVSSASILLIGALCCTAGTAWLLLFRNKSVLAKQTIG